MKRISVWCKVDTRKVVLLFPLHTEVQQQNNNILYYTKLTQHAFNTHFINVVLIDVFYRPKNAF